LAQYSFESVRSAMNSVRTERTVPEHLCHSVAVADRKWQTISMIL
jgi:hypothetical protein